MITGESKMDSTRKANLKEKGVTEENLKQLILAMKYRRSLNKCITICNEKEKIKMTLHYRRTKNEKLRSIDKDYKGKMDKNVD